MRPSRESPAPISARLWILRRISWFCWSAYAVLEGFSDWNVLAAHTPTFFPSWSDVGILAQVPLVLVAAIAFMRVVAPRLAVTVAYGDGLLMGGGVLLIGMATGYNSFLDGRTSALVSMITLAQPVTDVVALTLMAAVVARVGRKTRPVGLLIGAAMQLRTVIEGVERADQAEHLRASGYDLAQGYHFARPMEAAAIERALADAQRTGGTVQRGHCGAVATHRCDGGRHRHARRRRLEPHLIHPRKPRPRADADRRDDGTSRQCRAPQPRLRPRMRISASRSPPRR